LENSDDNDSDDIFGYNSESSKDSFYYVTTEDDSN